MWAPLTAEIVIEYENIFLKHPRVDLHHFPLKYACEDTVLHNIFSESFLFAYNFSLLNETTNSFILKCTTLQLKQKRISRNHPWFT